MVSTGEYIMGEEEVEESLSNVGERWISLWSLILVQVDQIEIRFVSLVTFVIVQRFYTPTDYITWSG